eukprot:Nitzschia sp. Nitz4//scaffold17_size182527//119990//120964//NITZ4_001866-RA/size182527-processed-gene-0.63-mRNA-1//-1//CDS//3329539376//3778//frame0
MSQSAESGLFSFFFPAPLEERAPPSTSGKEPVEEDEVVVPPSVRNWVLEKAPRPKPETQQRPAPKQPKSTPWQQKTAKRSKYYEYPVFKEPGSKMNISTPQPEIQPQSKRPSNGSRSNGIDLDTVRFPRELETSVRPQPRKSLIVDEFRDEVERILSLEAAAEVIQPNSRALNRLQLVGQPVPTTEPTKDAKASSQERRNRIKKEAGWAEFQERKVSDTLQSRRGVRRGFKTEQAPQDLNKLRLEVNELVDNLLSEDVKQKKHIRLFTPVNTNNTDSVGCTDVHDELTLAASSCGNSLKLEGDDAEEETRDQPCTPLLCCTAVW